MGRHKKGNFIKKNDASSVTFSVIPLNEENENQDNLKCVLKRVPIRTNKSPHANKNIASIVSKLDPELFGLNNDLHSDEFEKLCYEVYGHVPERLEKNRLDIEHRASLKDNNSEEIDENILISADTYFPLDGYDYEKHLCDPLPNPIALPKIDDIVPSNQEEKEALEALTAPEEYEELSEDFFDEAGSVDDMDKYLWGGIKPLLPDFDDQVFLDDQNIFQNKQTDIEQNPLVDPEEAMLLDLLREEYNHDGNTSDMGEANSVIQEQAAPQSDYTLLKSFLKSSPDNPPDPYLEHSHPNALKYDYRDPDFSQPLSSQEKEVILDLISRQDSDDEESLLNHDWFQPARKPEENCETISDTKPHVIRNVPKMIYGPSNKDRKLREINMAIVNCNNVASLLRRNVDLYSARVDKSSTSNNHDSTESFQDAKFIKSYIDNDPQKAIRYDTVDGEIKGRNELEKIHLLHASQCQTIMKERPRNETLEEKKLRKSTVKLNKKLARQRNKEYKAACKHIIQTQDNICSIQL